MSLTISISFLVLLLCNQIFSSDVSTIGSVPDPNKCTDASECVFPQICALCLEGYSPGCNQAVCTDGQCKIIRACSIYTPTKEPTTVTRTTTSEQCESDDSCPYPEYCAVECEPGLGPLCASAECVDGKCQTILPCSRKTRCTDNDISQCAVPQICAECLEGYSPGCATAACKDGQCQVIYPCSIPPPTDSTTTDSPPQCQTDGECSFVKQCVNECKDGFGPLCAIGNCVDGGCVITLPCSQGPQCTENDVSQCAVPKICGLCKEGYSPPCAQAVCENGQCRTIMPCTIYTDISTTTPAIGTCTSNSQCPRINDCVRKCPVGTSPRCTTVKCINGQCIYIKPCSQRPCATGATCPYNRRNCVTCAPGYGPRCEQPACISRICSVIPPCSNKISTAVEIAPN